RLQGDSAGRWAGEQPTDLGDGTTERGAPLPTTHHHTSYRTAPVCCSSRETTIVSVTAQRPVVGTPTAALTNVTGVGCPGSRGAGRRYGISAESEVAPPFARRRVASSTSGWEKRSAGGGTVPRRACGPTRAGTI